MHLVFFYVYILERKKKSNIFSFIVMSCCSAETEKFIEIFLLPMCIIDLLRILKFFFYGTCASEIQLLKCQLRRAYQFVYGGSRKTLLWNGLRLMEKCTFEQVHLDAIKCERFLSGLDFYFIHFLWDFLLTRK